MYPVALEESGQHWQPLIVAQLTQGPYSLAGLKPEQPGWRQSNRLEIPPHRSEYPSAGEG